MIKNLFLVVALALASSFASAQTFKTKSDNFTFDGNEVITSWDGIYTDESPYQEDMGTVSFTGNPNEQGITVPWQLGYLNNGGLVPCTPVTLSSPMWFPRPDGTLGDGSKSGDTYVKTGATACPYFTGEYGSAFDSNNRYDGFSVNAHYIVTYVLTHPRFRPPTLVRVDVLQGGSGTVNETVTN